ncbi:fucolectin-1-like isoform X2 [Toxotes jaculatrix]|uniref:fucolectin-1-like isoform X2 n=1 Tax=Toxotes jaculatrix TaxID=941984 RepID=UPI001B3ABDFD|nr:fucolectin-1-like isoform X2 [Toxotes jaculatrix]
MLWSLLLISLTASVRSDNNTVTDLSRTNLTSLTGDTSQSSNYTADNISYSADRAIDENEATCAHTLKEPNSWWQIDLLDVHSISCISIYNVIHHNTDLKSAKIYVGNSREKNSTSNKIVRNFTDFQTAVRLNFTFDKVKGRYITVFSPEDKHLVLCDVKIYGIKEEPPFKLIKEKKTWADALYHCRDQHLDLASILDEEAQDWAEVMAMEAETSFVWLGLRYTCTLEFWFWVEDHRLDYDRWEPNEKKEECNMSGAMHTQGGYHWYSKSDNETFNFICAVKKKTD